MRIAQENLGEVCLIDVVPGMAKGKSFDLDDCRNILNVPYQIEGTEDINQVKGSQVVVITAGLARKPGMTREDLLSKNSRILKEICEKVKVLAPDSIVIIVTNPLDAMTYYAVKILGFDRRKVFGMGVTLDGSRFANIISRELKVPVNKIQPVVIGSHGESMLPMPRFTMVGSFPLTEFAKDPAKIAMLVKKTVERGKEIVALFGSGSAYFAPSAAIASLVSAIIRDKRIPLGVSAQLNGEYGLEDICCGVPCVIGEQGIVKIVELDLNPQEKKNFLESVEAIRNLNALLK
ncbi:MAG: malate dehydrogenase [Candidatus Omnitrophica bacterium]|nr:malate dehydrogenase [Candidatus Omnitrophota bacterium]